MELFLKVTEEEEEVKGGRAFVRKEKEAGSEREQRMRESLQAFLWRPLLQETTVCVQERKVTSDWEEREQHSGRCVGAAENTANKIWIKYEALWIFFWAPQSLGGETDTTVSVCAPVDGNTTNKEGKTQHKINVEQDNWLTLEGNRQQLQRASQVSKLYRKKKTIEFVCFYLNLKWNHLPLNGDRYTLKTRKQHKYNFYRRSSPDSNKLVCRNRHCAAENVYSRAYLAAFTSHFHRAASE